MTDSEAARILRDFFADDWISKIGLERMIRKLKERYGQGVVQTLADDPEGSIEAILEVAEGR